jgi:hypothetical protein
MDKKKETPAPQKVTFKGKTEICTLLDDGKYYLYHPLEFIARARGVFCDKEEAEKIEPATYLNIRL